MEAEHGPLAGIIGHSAGASAAALAIRRGMNVPRAVLLSIPANPEFYATRFAKYLRMPPPVRDGMKRRLASRYAVGWEDHLRLIGPGESRAEVLVFHDRGDCRVPWREGAAVAAAWPGARRPAGDDVRARPPQDPPGPGTRVGGRSVPVRCGSGRSGHGAGSSLDLPGAAGDKPRPYGTRAMRKLPFSSDIGGRASTSSRSKPY